MVRQCVLPPMVENFQEQPVGRWIYVTGIMYRKSKLSLD